ncbi:cytidylate kinase-like family protein [Erysipelotrichaceae bacterium RD49]|nr:cytidylate kinase-like family protein [Erysipelotrichaceae bacterium RD49]
MEKPTNQLIIAIDREFGSGGKEIATILGRTLQLPVYEKNILQNLGIPDQKDVQDLYYRDESPRWKLTSRTVRGLTNSNEAALAAMEFDFLRDKASNGDSFIILGHCAEEVLKEYPCMAAFFISASDEFKIPRIMAEADLTEEEAIAKMKRHNWKRKNYHNSYCENKWGSSKNYDLCLRSDKLGTERSAYLLIDFVAEKYPNLFDYHVSKEVEESK